MFKPYKYILPPSLSLPRCLTEPDIENFLSELTLRVMQRYYDALMERPIVQQRQSTQATPLFEEQGSCYVDGNDYSNGPYRGIAI